MCSSDPNVIPAANKYNPISLTTKNMDLITNKIELSSLYFPIGVTAIASVCLITLAVLVFQQKQL